MHWLAHRVSIAPAVLITGLAAQSGAERLEPGRAVEYEIGSGWGGGVVLRVRCAVPVDGASARLRIAVTSASHDPSLRVEDAAGRLLGEDDDSGGGTDAFVELELAAAADLLVTVAAKASEGAGAVAVRCAVDAECAESLASAGLAAGLDEIERRLDGADHAGARAALGRLAAELDAVRGGAVSPTVFALRGRVVELALRAGDPALARECAELRRAFCERSLPPQHAELQRCLGDLARVLHAAGELDEAWRLQSGVLATLERTLPQGHPHVDVARSNAALLLVELGDPHGARPLQQRVADDFAARHPDGHPRLWIARQNLAATLRELGQPEQARALLESALAGWLTAVPDDHPAVQTVRANLASTLVALGDLPRARALAEQVLAVRSRTLPAGHSRLQSARTNLAAILVEQGELESAQALQAEVVLAAAAAATAHHPSVLAARENLALTLAMRGRLDAACEELEELLRARSAALPATHPELFATRVNLAMALAERGGDGDLAAARAQLEGALATAGALSATDPRRIEAAVELARLLAAQGDTDRLAVELAGVCRAVEQRLLRAARTSSPRHCVAAVAQARRAIAGALALLDRCTGAGLEERAFRMVEAARAIEVRAHAGGREGWENDGLRTRIALQRHRIAALARRGCEATTLRVAVEEKERLEAELASEPVAGEPAGATTPRQLAAALRTGEVAVGYWRTVADGAHAYLAWVVHPGGALRRVALGDGDRIERLVARWRELVVPPRAEDATARTGRLRELAVAGRDLRGAVVDPVTAAAPAARRWFVATAGALHLVPLDALPADGAGHVGDGTEVVHLVALRSLAGRPAAAAAPSLLAVGGVDYGAGPGAAAAFPPLAAARREVRAVAALFAAAFEAAPARHLAGSEATERALATAAAGARFLHVATHAWFAPDSVPSLADPLPIDAVTGWGRASSLADVARGFSPLVLCGLALAGANDPDGGGILTAEELAGLDLGGCELAVLSGCETALGLERGGQGLASLRRALHLAGARASITSLWAVPDRPTRRLMAAFYRGLWVERLPAAAALWRAKQSLISAPESEGLEPRDWAAWVLTGSVAAARLP